MRIEKAECNYQVTECDLKFGEQITLDGELLIPVSVFDKIRAELHATAEMHDDGDYYLRDEWIDEYFDKYREGENEKNKKRFENELFMMQTNIFPYKGEQE